jgi:hypothetical protein
VSRNDIGFDRKLIEATHGVEPDSAEPNQTEAGAVIVFGVDVKVAQRLSVL